MKTSPSFAITNEYRLLQLFAHWISRLIFYQRGNVNDQGKGQAFIFLFLDQINLQVSKFKLFRLQLRVSK
jgi:hypothetical protein